MLEVGVEQRGGKDTPDAVEVQRPDPVVTQGPAEYEGVDEVDSPLDDEKTHRETEARGYSPALGVVLRIPAIDRGRCSRVMVKGAAWSP